MDVNALVAALFGAGGAGLLASGWQVVRSWRSDKVVNEGNLIERLDRRLTAAERERDLALKERDEAREQAIRYRLLAIAKHATPEELAEAAKLDA